MVEECPDEMKEKVEEFKNLLKTEPKLHVRTDNNFILRHLRAAEGDVATAFEKIKNYYAIKRDNPEWYATESPSVYSDLLDTGCDYILEERDTSGKRIWIHQPRKIDSSKTSLTRQSRMHDLLLETILDEDETQRKGMVVIVDMKDFPWSLMRWLTPGNARVAMRKADSLPFPKLEYHIVNTSIFFNFILKVSYPFMSAKQKESLFIHGDDFASLHEKVDPAVLPEEYGGKKPNRAGDKLNSIVYDNAEKLAVNLNLGYQE